MKMVLLIAFGAAFVLYALFGVARGAIYVPVRRSFFSFGSDMKDVRRSEEPARFWTAIGLLVILGGVLTYTSLRGS
jgi:hypothetical protein